MLLALLGRAQPVIPPNLYSLFINIKAWGPQVILAARCATMFRRVIGLQPTKMRAELDSSLDQCMKCITELWTIDIVNQVDGLFKTNILRVSPVNSPSCDELIPSINKAVANLFSMSKY